MFNTLDELKAEIRPPHEILAGFLEQVKPLSNGWSTALCPFHQDSSPSFSTHLTSGNWKCFSCDKAGGYYQIPNNPGNPLPTTYYEYRNEQTNAVEYVKVRYFPKTFRLFTPGKNGELMPGKLAPTNYLYGWSEVKDKTGPVYLVEGEKDADTLIKAGLRACTPGGSSQWDNRFKELLENSEVYLVPDNDQAGTAWVKRITAALGNIVRGIIPMPAEDVKDISDWYSKGFRLEQLEIQPVDYVAGSGESVGLVDLSRMPEPKPRPKVWGEFVPDNVITILYADGGVGKSLFTLVLAHYLALGKDFLGIPALGLSSVAFFDWELNVDEHLRRSYQVSRGLGLPAPPPGLWYMHPESSLERCSENIHNILRARKIRLAVVDSMGPACGGDTNNAETVINFCQQLLKFEIPVIVIDHQSKPSANAPDGMKPYGSVYKWNLARSVIKLERKSAEVGTESDYTLMQLKNNFGPLAPPLHFKTHYDRVANSFIYTKREEVKE